MAHLVASYGTVNPAAGQELLARKMTEGSSAVEYVELAYGFGIEFDSAPLERHLRIRELSGGLSPQELSAKLSLFRRTRSPEDLVRFLESEQETLRTVLSPKAHAFLLIKALIAARQLDRASFILTEHRESFEAEFERLMDEIRIRRGEDVTQSIEDRFLANDSEVDLINLCTNLRDGPDSDKLRRYTLELFSRQRNLHNARRVVEALDRLDRDQELINFLDNCDDLVGLDDELASIRAWTLFTLGRVSEAREIVERLVRRRDNPNDSSLQMNVLLMMGDWEKFSHVVDREWERRATRDPKFLLQLALVAADFDQQRALLLTQEAAAKGLDDPKLLASAAILAYRLGHDDMAMPWIADAARLSSPEDGPVVTKNLPEIIEASTAWADRTSGIEEAVSAGQIPIHLAASMWNTSIARIFVTQPIHNERERDPRRRTVVPVRHGSRGLADVSQVQTLSADFTSLLLVSELGLPLNHAAIMNAPVFDNRPFPMVLAVLAANLGAQKHDADSRFDHGPARHLVGTTSD